MAPYSNVVRENMQLASERQFEALISRCLTCQHSIRIRFQNNPKEKDPLYVKCKIKDIQERFKFMCDDNYWDCKVINCSEYVEEYVNSKKE